MIVKNREELISSNLRARAVGLIESGITRVLPANLLRTAVKYNHDRRILRVMGTSYDVSHGRIFVVGGGKAAGLMAEELEKIIDPAHITAGIVNCKSGGYQTSKILIRKAGHPLPDDAGVNGMHEMLALKSRHSIGKGDLVICLISGGGSALMPSPAGGITLENQQEMTQLLLRSGADIKEINTVRKHISEIKGGRLGAFYEPAKIVSLIISDVVGDDLNTIASAPTVADPTTFRQAQAVLEKYGLLDLAPKTVVDFIKRGMNGLEAETPKESRNCDNYIIGNNGMCLEAMAEKARDLGLRPVIVTAELTGDTAAVARQKADEIVARKYKGFDVILLGGETTSTLPENSGKGGRNQHYAAVSMLAMQKLATPWVVASVGTDGSDYVAEAAGAMVDDRSLPQAQSAGIDVDDYIARFDSYELFRRMTRSLIITGPTGTNVMDVILYLLG